MLRIYMMLLCCFIFFYALPAQLLNLPESVEYDPYNNRYLVSNWGNGNIVEIDSTGTQSVWLYNVHCYAGLHRQDSILYVACREYGVKGFNLLTGENILNVSIPGTVNCNDIVADNAGNLYVSSPTGNQIMQIVIETGEIVDVITSGLNTPNGMYYDEPNNRILFVSFRYNTPIQQIDLSDNSVSVITYPGLNDLDGITQDNDGNFYVSSWQQNRVYIFNSTFSEGPEIFTTHFGDPADIFFDKINNVLAVPLFYIHQVDFVEVPATATEELEYDDLGLMVQLSNYPNPFNPHTTISFQLLDTSAQETLELEIYNIKGQRITELPVILNGVERSTNEYSTIWNGTDHHGSSVASGLYFCHLKTEDRIVAKRKMLLMK